VSVTVLFEEPIAAKFNDLAALNEHIGFFLADWNGADRRFSVREWRAVADDEYRVLTDFHVALKDSVRGSVIKWAWDSGACLIETHSHGRFGRVGFSPTDVSGLEEWVPHLWWRLSGRPYAALVSTGESVDGWAWITAANQPEQIDRVILGSTEMTASGRSFRSPWMRKPGE
jgi:hypothetical protein